jgi:hypothetical protein
MGLKTSIPFFITYLMEYVLPAFMESFSISPIEVWSEEQCRHRLMRQK